MLRRILGGLAIASLVLGLAVLIFWWRSYRHVDHFTLGNLNSHQTEFVTHNGYVMVKTSDNIGGIITSRSEPHPFSQVAWACLIIPAFWLAVWVRGKFPRVGQRGSRIEDRG
jgi:hypothetical protein